MPTSPMGMLKGRTRWLLACILALLLLAGGAWLLRTHRSTPPEAPYQALDLNFLAAIPVDEDHVTDQDIPEVYRKLDGQKVVITGLEYWSTSAETMVDHFLLVKPFEEFHPPGVTGRVFAETPPGKKVPAFGGLVRAYGTFHVRVVRHDAHHILSLYTLTVDRVEETTP